VYPRCCTESFRGRNLLIVAVLASACAPATDLHPPRVGHSPYRAWADSQTELAPSSSASATEPAHSNGTDGDGAPDVNEPATPPVEPEPSGPRIEIEPSYAWGEASPIAASELEPANRGGEGALTGKRPKAAGHPHPRVIVDVPPVGGPHRKKSVLAKARSGSWNRIIRCYQEDAYARPDLEGEVSLRATVTGGGKLTRLRVAKSTFPKDTGVANCFKKRLGGMKMPQARKSSSAKIVIKLWPGDDPLPPPPGVDVERGPGSLRHEPVAEALSTQLGGFHACYEEALASYAPELWGRLAIRVHVDASGVVDEAFQVESSFPDEHVVRCALKHAHTLQLPAPEGGDVRWVLALRLAPQ